MKLKRRGAPDLKLRIPTARQCLGLLTKKGKEPRHAAYGQACALSLMNGTRDQQMRMYLVG